MTDEYSRHYLSEVARIAEKIDLVQVTALVEHLRATRDRNGRVFVAGVGGGAGNASHAAADLRGLADIEAYALTDNVSGLTALINDRGWDSSLSTWLDHSRLAARDAVLVFSVGGGSLDPPVSVNVVRALEFARARGATVLGVVGRDGGTTARLADACVIVPVVNSETVTPHTEAFQAVLWHLAVTHPQLSRTRGRWESLSAAMVP
ncbi:SIS domain-containing protein [Actinomadura rubrisoli]|uniref:SIS domain-containing protein n=1 Tax=Actinomadura rubrisoli TaxID=2530368 RepID=A0A4R5CBL9_9ACTN|nr:SIS domain-containing protein [Actinomadura rubrisoli]TDD96795.1 SIS domain-containing protein [Actinomadura rubrisoli]